MARQSRKADTDASSSPPLSTLPRRAGLVLCARATPLLPAVTAAAVGLATARASERRLTGGTNTRPSLPTVTVTAARTVGDGAAAAATRDVLESGEPCPLAAPGEAPAKAPKNSPALARFGAPPTSSTAARTRVCGDACTTTEAGCGGPGLRTRTAMSRGPVAGVGRGDSGAAGAALPRALPLCLLVCAVAVAVVLPVAGAPPCRPRPLPATAARGDAILARATPLAARWPPHCATRALPGAGEVAGGAVV